MEARAASLAALAGSLGGPEAASPGATRVEVTALVAAPAPDAHSAHSGHSAHSARSWPEDLPSTSARSARLRSLFLYGSAVPPDPEAGPSAPAPPPSPPPPPLAVHVSSACETGRAPAPAAS